MELEIDAFKIEKLENEYKERLYHQKELSKPTVKSKPEIANRHKTTLKSLNRSIRK